MDYESFLNSKIVQVNVLCGDALTELQKLSAESVQCCVTSPPYFGLRDYGQSGQIGLEATPAEYVAKMVVVFDEVRRVLKPDGTLWLNLGDSYATGTKAERQASTGLLKHHTAQDIRRIGTPDGLKTKDLIGIPWMVAFALRADGWYLRSDIIWHKPNPMPESVTDRPTKAHEYIFLLTKSARYYYNTDAITEPLSKASIERLTQPNLGNQNGSNRIPGKTNGNMKAVSKYSDGAGSVMAEHRTKAGISGEDNLQSTLARSVEKGTRNKRSVWTVTTNSYSGAHFATFPPDLIKPCILAGSKPGDTILDPFGGSGTTGHVAMELGRKAVLIELNPDYVKLIHNRCDNITPAFAL